MQLAREHPRPVAAPVDGEAHAQAVAAPGREHVRRADVPGRRDHGDLADAAEREHDRQGARRVAGGVAPGHLEQRRHAGEAPGRAHLLGLGQPAGRRVPGEHHGPGGPALGDPLGALDPAERLAGDAVLVAEARIAMAEDDADVVPAGDAAQRPRGGLVADHA